MAPLVVASMNSSRDVNNDEAFLSLLSSQRALLHKLNMEGTTQRQQSPAIAMTVPMIQARNTGSIIGTVDPLSLMNTPIMEQQGSMDMLLSHRITMGHGNNNFGLPPFREVTGVEESKLKDFENPNQKKLGRRRTSLASMFDNQHYTQQQRRLSTVSNLSVGYNEVFGRDTFDVESPKEISKNVWLDPGLTDDTVKANLRAFSKAMDDSTKSQQDIHTWDRKMGLKRSHSKTMRNTMKTRKKLRSMLKKDINALSKKT